MTPTKKLIQGESIIYDRRLVRDVPGIADTSTKFKLENGFYINEDETIICRSTDITGKFFKKERATEVVQAETTQ